MKRSANQWCARAVALLCCVWMGMFAAKPVSADVFSDVPEAKNFQLLYSLEIPLRGNYLTTLPAYQTDKSKSLSGSVRRIAYYLSLEPKSGKRQFVYVSMDAFTQNFLEMGVPSGLLGVTFQKNVSNMNVVSNVAGITNGKGLQGGNLEFWPRNYTTTNAKRVPNASDTVYDSGDNPVATGGYGSMQIHNHTLGVTLFAYNNWGLGGANCDLGIGNNTVKASNNVVHKDWTFRQNCASYTKRTLQVLVELGKPPAGTLLKLKKPLERQVIQRQANNKAWVTIEGQAAEVPSSVEARVVAVQSGTSTSWKVIASAPSGKTFSGRLEVEAGWYELQVRYRKNGAIADTQSIKPFGVGEVFVIAGQSNSANSGKPAQKAKDPRVTNYGFGAWVPAIDPMLIATGNGGSPWPLMGDQLAALWNVPIGIISVGWGGTSVGEWLPIHTGSRQLYPRLKDALAVVGLRGARAILWHQGESDSAGKTSQAVYAQRLNAVIRQSRKDAGWDIPWYIAGVSYLPKADKAAMKAIRDAQDQVVASHPQNFAGPITDDLFGTKWRYDNVHFNQAGLVEHAKRWVTVLRFPPCRFAQVGDECAPEPVPEPQAEPRPEGGAETEPSMEKDEPISEPGQEQVGPETDAEPESKDAGADGASAPEPTVEPASEPLNPKESQPEPQTQPEPTTTSDTSETSDVSQPTEKPAGGGCGCQQSGGEGLGWLFALVVLWSVISRKRFAGTDSV